MQKDTKGYILEEYKRLGGCGDIYRDLLKCQDTDALVDVYLKHPDWCMELGFPSMQELRERFSKYDHKGVFLDKEFHGDIIMSQVAIFHNCKGYIKVAMDYDNAVIPMLYFGNGCQMHISCDQRNVIPIYVPLYIFGENLITTEGKNNAKFRRYEH